MNKAINYRSDIDGLRAVAVLAVLVFHCFPGTVSGGFVGVDVFFVISGYLISSILFSEIREKNFSFLRFYQRRIVRLAPALIITLAGCLGMGWFLLPPDEYAQLGKHTIAAAFYVNNFLLWKEAGYFDTEATGKPLLHLWSLAVEEQFYLIWPLACLILITSAKAPQKMIAALAATSLAASCFLFPLDPDANYYLPLTRFWQLLAGALLAASTSLPAFLSTPPRRSALSIFGLSAILLATIITPGNAAYSGFRGILPVLGAMALIASGPAAWANHRLLSSRPAVFIGKISYPLYLYHWPILVFCTMKYLGNAKAYVVPITVTSSLALSWLTYAYLERPSRAAADKKKLCIILLSVILTCAIVGGAVYHSRGVPGRLPAHLKSNPVTPVSGKGASVWGMPGCVLEYLVKEIRLPSHCIHDSKGMNIVIWGDSHASNLYHGLRVAAKKVQSETFRKEQRVPPIGFSQLTARTCSPFVRDDSGPKDYRKMACHLRNELFLKKIAAIKPDVVLLSARWGHYDPNINAITSTINELKRLKIPNIIVIGPYPVWTQPLPRILFNQSQKKSGGSDNPLYMKEGLVRSRFEIDEKMRQLTENAGATYESVLDKLCNEDGCRTRAEKNVMQFDTDHLTLSGSIYLVKALSKTIFEKPEAKPQ